MRNDKTRDSVMHNAELVQLVLVGLHPVRLWSNTALRAHANTILIVASVKEVLSAQLPLCLNCVVERTSRRIYDVIREIDAMTLRFVEGRCLGCTRLVSIVVTRPSMLLLRTRLPGSSTDRG
jgi:hypothetical protein